MALMLRFSSIHPDHTDAAGGNERHQLDRGDDSSLLSAAIRLCRVSCRPSDHMLK